MRPDGRAADALRPVVIETGAQTYPDGSALVSFGDTRVLCAATVEEGAPR
jgi:ribonuclease PH